MLKQAVPPYEFFKIKQVIKEHPCHHTWVFLKYKPYKK